MSQVYRLAIADEEPSTVLLLKQFLHEAGHEVVVEARSGEELLQRTIRTDVDVIIADINMHGIDALSAVETILKRRELPIIVLSASFDEELIDRANDCGAFGYLIKPIRSEELLAAIAVAVKRFDEFQHLRQDAATLRQALANRKIIEQAKGVLMTKHGIEESDAFLEIQRAARDSRVKIIDVAKGILLASRVQTDPPHDQPTRKHMRQ